ncbi:hypothetical protein AURDEDRAFT_127878 [Auricularia subglabra TFB-10046 SS5]|nr:hypothetical protein AURDEDRAFT_127878 [Auricularia subglabra TFB-10046 SS5]
MAALVSGATGVTWAKDTDDCEITIIASFSGDITRQIRFPYAHDFDYDQGGGQVLRLFANAQQGLDRVRELHIPAEELPDLLERRVLHWFSQLTLSLADVLPKYTPDFKPLTHLPDVLAACPSVVLIVLMLLRWRWPSYEELSNDALREFLAVLERLDAAALPEIELRRFEEETLRNMPHANMESFRMRLTVTSYVHPPFSDWDME